MTHPCRYCRRDLDNPAAKACTKCQFDLAKRVARAELDRGMKHPEPLREHKPEGRSRWAR